VRWNRRIAPALWELLAADKRALPCPFCGAVPLHYVGSPLARQTDALHCLNCGIYASGDFHPNSAINRWNRRHAIDASMNADERLDDAM